MITQENKKVWKLLPYQSKWAQDKTPVKIFEKSRRIGLSWAEAYDSVMYAGEGNGNIYYQSYNQDMTRGFIYDCADWAKSINVVSGAVGELLIDIGDDEKIPAFRLPLANGKEIVAMSSSPRAFRSKGRPGDRAVIDEAAFVDDLKEVLKAAMAFRVWGGQVHILSTHNGEDNTFNRLVTEVREGKQESYSLHRATLDDAIDAGLTERIFDVAGRKWYPGARQDWRAEMIREYRENADEELLCIPSKSGGAWLQWQWIRSAEHVDAGISKKYTGKECYIGVDVARRNDLWVAVVLEKIGDVLWVRDLHVEQNIPFSLQDEIIARMVYDYKVIRIAIDQTGMGEKPVEDMQQLYGKHRVEGVLLSAPRRLAVASSLKKVMEDKRIRIPADEALQRDLHSIKAQVSITGSPRLVADRSGTDGHADRFWALALACAAASEFIPQYDYQSLRSYYNDDNDDDDFTDRWSDGLGSANLGRGAYG